MKRDVSRRILKDCNNQLLTSGDIVIVADDSSIRFGVFWNTFDNGSGWKTRVRAVSKWGNGLISFGNSVTINDTIRYRSPVDSSADTIEDSCGSIFKLETAIDSKPYFDAISLRDQMIELGKISKVGLTIEKQAKEDSKPGADFLMDTISKLGAPNI